MTVLSVYISINPSIYLCQFKLFIFANSSLIPIN